MMAKEKYTKEQADALAKSLKGLMPEDEIKVVVEKALRVDKNDIEKSDKDETNEQLEKLILDKKAEIEKSKKELVDLEKSLLEGKIKKPATKSEEIKEEKIEKSKDSSNDDLLKSIDTLISEKIGKIEVQRMNFSEIEKSIKESNERYDKLEKSFNEFMDSPISKPKAVISNYGVIEKSIKTDKNGNKIIPLSNSKAIVNELEKSLKSNKITEEQKRTIRNSVSKYELYKSLDDEVIDIIKSTNDIEIEK